MKKYEVEITGRTAVATILDEESEERIPCFLI